MIEMQRRELLALTTLLLAGVGCRDKEKELKAQIAPALDVLFPLIKRDTKQVREGLPKVANVIVKHLDEDPAADAEGVGRALQVSRAEVKPLAFSKITFFCFVGPDGKVVRSQLSHTGPDRAATHSVTEAIPDTKKLLTPDAKVLETFGYMEGLRGVNLGNKLQWVVGAPVKNKDGKLLGAVLAGWSLRLYAKYLDDNVQTHLEKADAGSDKPTMLYYTFIVKGKQAFGGPDAPDVIATALGELDLLSKVKGSDLFETTLTVDGPKFLVGAKKASDLADDVFVVLLMSPV